MFDQDWSIILFNNNIQLLILYTVQFKFKIQLWIQSVKLKQIHPIPATVLPNRQIQALSPYSGQLRLEPHSTQNFAYNPGPQPNLLPTNEIFSIEFKITEVSYLHR